MISGATTCYQNLWFILLLSDSIALAWSFPLESETVPIIFNGLFPANNLSAASLID